MLVNNSLAETPYRLRILHELFIDLTNDNLPWIRLWYILSFIMYLPNTLSEFENLTVFEIHADFEIPVKSCIEGLNFKNFNIHIISKYYSTLKIF